MMKKYLLTTLTGMACALFAAGCTPVAPNDTPDSITLSAESIQVPAEGTDAQTLTVTTPARPLIGGVPDWIAWTEGVFDRHQISYSFSVAPNTAYTTREAVITLSASALSGTFRVTQAAAARPAPGPDPDPATEDAAQIASRLGLGWNMGNQFDGFYNGSWAGALEGYPEECVWQPGTADEKEDFKATQATFDGVREAGFASVRIPISWLKMIGPAPDYTIDAAWMARIHEVVDYAHAAGLNVIINTHHDENHGADNDYQWLDIKHAVDDPALNEAIQAEIRAVWTQIATEFRDCGGWLVMESFNEINDGGWGWSEDFRTDPTRQCDILNGWNQVFVDAVRATGGKNATRWLGVPTYAANPEFAVYSRMPRDPAGKTLLAVHFYDPYEYTIGEEQYSDWGHNGAGGRKATWGDEDHVKASFAKLKADYLDKGVPVYLGEFGCSMRKRSDARAWAFFKYYLEYVVKAAKTYGIPCFLWDNGAGGTGREQHGYIHHGTGACIGSAREAVDVMARAWDNPDPDYTLQSVYDHSPKY
uniref:Gycosyl hydrolase 5 n=1 Tax=uncultured Bacteroidota bacterium TaxID=152509 RepID=A0A097KUR6_9BACT|nr:gycosyl hydrolase 5 [uncultured Bacteroidetes bacterium]